MFPEAFAEKHLVLSPDNATILDPFSGRGTTVFQSLLSGRVGLGVDVNPVAVCVSRAKADPPTAAEVRARIDDLEAKFEPTEGALTNDPFFQACYHVDTLQQVLWLRDVLAWRTDRVDCFIAAMACGCLHGESHRSARVFSNRMPRTIATKPAYSVRWWEKHGYVAPARDVFDILRQEADFRFVSPIPALTGVVKEGDARRASVLLEDHAGKVDAVITSPPYLDVTHFREDQWLRVWFLGGDPAPCSATEGDDRHWKDDNYWRFREDSWSGVGELLKPKARFAIRIGGKGFTTEIAKEGLERTLRNALGKVTCTSASMSEIQRGQLRAFRPNAAGLRNEFDLVFEVSS